MKTFIKNNKDLITVLVTGLALLILAMTETCTGIRWALGIPFVFFLSGYPLSTLFPAHSSLERLMISSGFSLLLTYPAAIITAAIEGKTGGEVIYGPHFVNSISVLLAITFATSVVAYFFRKKSTSKPEKINKLAIGGILAISALLNFMNLGRADLNGDEYDIGYRAYYLVDGMVAGRNGFLLSFMGHTPLAAFINHFSMQTLSTAGFEDLSEGMIRFATAFAGVICVLFLYKLGKELFNEKVGLWSALILAVSSYHVWMSRIFLREVFMTFFIILTIYFLFKALKEDSWKHTILAGIFFGALLLTKILGGFLAGVIIIFILLYKNKYKVKKLFKKTLGLFGVSALIFSPIIAYNAGAYITTGYMDIFFSRVFGVAHPYGYTGEKAHGIDFAGIFELLIDQYSLLLFLLFAIATIFTCKKIKKPEIGFQIIFLAVALAFFTASGVRAYYLPFLTIPFALTTGYFLTKFKKTTIIAILILAYSGYYSYNTNISESYVIDDKWIDSGRTGYEKLTIEPFEYHYSRSARAWSEDYGWQDLQEFVEENLGQEATLIIDEDLDDQMIQYYFDISQEVKQFYYDGEYEERYNYTTVDNLQAGYLITIADKTYGYDLLWETADFKIYEVSF